MKIKKEIYILASTSGSVIGSTVLTLVMMVISQDFSFDTAALWCSSAMGAYMAYFGFLDKWNAESKLNKEQVTFMHKTFAKSIFIGFFFLLSFEEIIQNILTYGFEVMVNNLLSESIKIAVVSIFGTLLSGVFAIQSTINGTYNE